MMGLDWWTKLLAALMCIFCILSVSGNTLILTALFRDRSLNNRSNKFVRNLAFADLCVGAWTMSVTFSSMMHQDWIFDLAGSDSPLYIVTCNFSAFLDNLLLTARMWTLAASSVDRYILICHSGRYRDIISKSRVKALLVLIWLVAMVAAVPPLLGWSRFGYSDSSFNCGIVPDADWTPHKWYFLYFFIFTFPLPLLIIIICYYCIFSTTLASNSTIIMQNHIASKELSNGVSNNSKEKPSMQLVGRRASAMIATPNRKSQKRMWMMLRVTISIFLIVTASVVSVMPILIIGILGWSGVSLSISDRMHQVVHWIFVGNSAINPIVFGLMNPLIRSSIYNILKNATPRDLERVS